MTTGRTSDSGASDNRSDGQDPVDPVSLLPRATWGSFGELFLSEKETSMAVILVYIALVIVGDAAAVAIATFVERFSEPVSLMVFFALFIFVFWIGWIMAVRVTERYLIRSS
jgi:hypothetical protein